MTESWARDTTLGGAVVTADRVTADVGGNLVIESRQDTATAAAKESSSGASVSVCIPPLCVGPYVMGSASGGSARGSGSFASVSEQSGIQAGDGGFDVNVKGNTKLVGGVIASTDAAVEGQKNSFQSGSLTSSDIVNTDTFHASGASVALGYNSGSSAGIGKAEGERTSITASGISGIAGNKEVRTGDGSNGLVPSWKASELLTDVNAQVQITSTASGILVQMTPQLVEGIKALLASGSSTGVMGPSQIDRALGEFERLKSDSSLTPEQRAQLQGLQSFFEAAVKTYGPRGEDTVAGGRSADQKPVFLFLLTGLGGTAAGGAAAGSGVAGLQSGTEQNQGYRDPESGQWSVVSGQWSVVSGWGDHRR